MAARDLPMYDCLACRTAGSSACGLARCRPAQVTGDQLADHIGAQTTSGKGNNYVSVTTPARRLR